ncbi:DUF3060 domain-containing protein [Mycobacterium talmoniae]|uniref:DUF3060 domain-containing protein n=1 Tax=Mycobacterium talmoniae TaxID=1858794 RepID=A0A1S1NLG6_9MYCO|nr:MULTISPECIES: DUF3060 domain-containing protein [Mycobacterium]OHV04892.1 hypothetical protein BKN37_07970 [Mycobacterium talmoniae]PQM46515.1 hypothetical protein C1Y40_03322 [Mycobacterium talmoniae]TDH53891.1 DUF3060 domain-containing protein [Mycobacterium eburneum]
MRTHVPVIAVGVVAAVIGLAGCGGSKTTNPETSGGSSSKKTTAQFEIGDTLNYGSFGTTAELDCADGKTLDVGGSNNTLTVKGSCKTVRVAGADNKITIDKVDESLTVVGMNNTVTYKDGDPKVDDHGSGNTVNKG